MHMHRVEARDLPDLWFQAVYDILDHGRRFTIDRGSFAGQTRLEYDYFTGYVKFPGTRPILPDIPVSWRTVNQFPTNPGDTIVKFEASGIVQRFPFGTFAGIVVALVPRFKTRPLTVRHHAGHGAMP